MRAPCWQAVLHAPVVQAAQARLTTPAHSSLQAFSEGPLGQPAPDEPKCQSMPNPSLSETQGCQRLNVLASTPASRSAFSGMATAPMIRVKMVAAAVIFIVALFDDLFDRGLRLSML